MRSRPAWMDGEQFSLPKKTTNRSSRDTDEATTTSATDSLTTPSSLRDSSSSFSLFLGVAALPTKATRSTGGEADATTTERTAGPRRPQHNDTSTAVATTTTASSQSSEKAGDDNDNPSNAKDSSSCQQEAQQQPPAPVLVNIQAPAVVVPQPPQQQQQQPLWTTGGESLSSLGGSLGGSLSTSEWNNSYQFFNSSSSTSQYNSSTSTLTSSDADAAVSSAQPQRRPRVVAPFWTAGNASLSSLGSSNNSKAPRGATATTTTLPFPIQQQDHSSVSSLSVESALFHSPSSVCGSSAQQQQRRLVRRQQECLASRAPPMKPVRRSSDASEHEAAASEITCDAIQAALELTTETQEQEQPNDGNNKQADANANPNDDKCSDHSDSTAPIENTIKEVSIDRNSTETTPSTESSQGQRCAPQGASNNNSSQSASNSSKSSTRKKKNRIKVPAELLTNFSGGPFSGCDVMDQKQLEEAVSKWNILSRSISREQRSRIRSESGNSSSRPSSRSRPSRDRASPPSRASSAGAAGASSPRNAAAAGFNNNNRAGRSRSREGGTRTDIPGVPRSRVRSKSREGRRDNPIATPNSIVRRGRSSNSGEGGRRDVPPMMMARQNSLQQKPKPARSCLRSRSGAVVRPLPCSGGSIGSRTAVGSASPFKDLVRSKSAPTVRNCDAKMEPGESSTGHTPPRSGKEFSSCRWGTGGASGERQKKDKPPPQPVVKPHYFPGQ